MTRNIPLLCSRISLFFTNIQNEFDSQSLAILRRRNMSWLTLGVVALFCVSQANSAGHTPLPYVKGNFLRWSIQIIGFSVWFVYNFMVSLENTWFIQGRASKFRHALGSNDKDLSQATPAVTRSFSVSYERHPPPPLCCRLWQARGTEVVLLSPGSLWDRKVYSVINTCK